MNKQHAPETLVSIYLDEDDQCQYAMKKKRAHNKLEFFGVSQFAGMGWIFLSLTAVAITMTLIAILK
ncbi:MAG: hypothetical protein RL095_2521 [Verrucomicrobiota bacterium]|jgi:hypothetical protein